MVLQSTYPAQEEKIKVNTNESIERRLHELREIAKNYAKAEAQRNYLEEFKKSKLAILMKRFEPKFPTSAAQEREARAHVEYHELLEGLREATEQALALKWELEIVRMRVDLWRTKQANERSERKAYGAQ